MTHKIGILGEGITGTAVKKKIEELEGLVYVKPEEADWLVVSPGIPPNQIPTIKGEVISEIEFAYRLFQEKNRQYKPKLIAITGTNGKTTVTELISHCGGYPVAGNIGIPLIEYVDHVSQPKWIAVEVSSFQLEACTTFKPDIAIVLNLTQDHLERHKTMKVYQNEKEKITASQTSKDHIIYNNKCVYTNEIGEKSNAIKHPFNDQIENSYSQDMTSIKEHHNASNIWVAYKALELTGVGGSTVKDRWKTFQWPEHRLEAFATINNTTFVNDSKSTNPDAALKALNAYSGHNIELILCGVDKQLDLTAFIKEIVRRVSKLIVFGDIGQLIDEKITKSRKKNMYERVESIEDAVKLTTQNTEKEKVVLFSPASASFDQFDSYKTRGKIFKELVLKYCNAK